ncbi:MAG TPA: hypothetical protein VFY68_15900 [Nitrososphaeraceae archaeon]|nr:hypothetical protein [Nitrososphaeraceae archaeon]
MIAITLLLSGSLVLTSVMAQEQEKIMIFVHCFDCPSNYEYLIKVFEPTDNPNSNPKLIGEKKFTSEDLSSDGWTGNDKIYLDKKFIGKKLGFELISLTSGLSSSKSVYIVDEVQGIEFYPPVG